MFRPHWVCPAHGCVLSLSTLLRLQAALQGVGPELHAVPVFRYSTKAQIQLGLHFVPSPALAAQAERSLTGALSPGAVRLLPSVVLASVSIHARASLVCLVSLLGSWFLNCDPPGRCPPSRILGSLWLETRSLFAVR